MKNRKHFIEVLWKILIEHEGVRYKPYLDTLNMVTIGVGRNLQRSELPLSPQELRLLLHETDDNTHLFEVKFDLETLSVSRTRDLRTGLTRNEVYRLLQNDIQQCADELVFVYSWFKPLSRQYPMRAVVILGMVFAMGLYRFKGFVETIGYIEREDYDSAAAEMLNSRWAKQVTWRALRYSYMMKHNEYMSENDARQSYLNPNIDYSQTVRKAVDISIAEAGATISTDSIISDSTTAATVLTPTVIEPPVLPLKPTVIEPPVLPLKPTVGDTSTFPDDDLG